jgi:hypothetical protein
MSVMLTAAGSHCHDTSEVLHSDGGESWVRRGVEPAARTPPKTATALCTLNRGNINAAMRPEASLIVEGAGSSGARQRRLPPCPFCAATQCYP